MARITGRLLLLFYAVQLFGATIEKQVRMKNEYHEMCGCEIIWANHFEGGADPDQPDFSGGLTRSPGARGTQHCFEVSPQTPTWSAMTFPACVVEEIQGQNNRLTGSFLAPQLVYVKMYAEYAYTPDGGTAVVTKEMDRIYVVGNGDWKNFSYYLDFSDVTNISQVKLYAKADPLFGVSQTVKVDEFRLCQFCDGNLGNDLPVLADLKFFDGSSNELKRLTPSFQSANGYYTLTIPNSVSGVQVQPTLKADAQFSNTEIRVNGTLVTSGNISSLITVNLTNDNNNPQIEVVLSSAVASECPIKNYYTIEVLPNEPLPDATLFSLKMVGEDQELSPPFNSNTYSYQVIYNPGTETVKLIPVANEKGAQITVNGEPVESGDESQEIDISTTSTVSIVVTSVKDPTITRTYTVSFAPKADVIYVKATGGDDENDGWPEWSDAKATIEAAVNEAKRLGPTPDHPISIWVAAGTYFPQPFDDQYIAIDLDEYINLYGGFPTNGGEWEDRINNRLVQLTIIDADKDQDDANLWAEDDPSSFTQIQNNLNTAVKAAANCIIDGFIITHGFGRTYTYDWGGGGSGTILFGGAVYAVSASMFTISNCTMIDNGSLHHGGAIKLDGADITINSCSFINNKSIDESGGAIYCTGGDLLVVNDCSFDGNTASISAGVVGNKGGAIYSSYANTSVINSIFSANKTGDEEQNGYGGAIYLAGENVEVLNSQFYYNIAGDGDPSSYSYGGAIYSTAEETNFKNNVFFANSASFGASVAMENQIATQNFVNCLFVKNEAYLGGGIFFRADQGDNGLGASLKVINCTFAANLSSSGEALFVYYYHDGEQMELPQITNSIIWYTQIGNIYGAILSDRAIPLSNNNWIQNFQNQPDVNNPQFNVTDMSLIQDKDDIIGSDGGVSADDAFMLGSSSPCLGAGQGSDNTTFLDFFRIENNSPIDITGSSRIAGNPLLIDIGAYEAQ